MKGGFILDMDFAVRSIAIVMLSFVFFRVCTKILDKVLGFFEGLFKKK